MTAREGKEAAAGRGAGLCRVRSSDSAACQTCRAPELELSSEKERDTPVSLVSAHKPSPTGQNQPPGIASRSSLVPARIFLTLAAGWRKAPVKSPSSA